MRNKKWMATPLLVLLVGVGAGGCRVRQTQEGEVPKVEVKGGQVPKYDVDAPKVEVKTEERTVKVPTGVDVTYPEDTQPKPPAQ